MMPRLLITTHPMKPRTNSGTNGGRFPPCNGPECSIAWGRRRSAQAIPANTGASISTLASLTVTAIDKAPPPMMPPAAITWATSWVDSPIHTPACSAESPKIPDSAGINKIMVVPYTTTIPRAVATSSSSESVTESVAATAAAPQIENPEAMSSRWLRDIFNHLPVTIVIQKVSPTAAMIETITHGPSPKTTPSGICNPSKTIPSRKIGFWAVFVPVFNTAGYGATFRQRRPRMMATTNPLIVGMGWAISMLTTPIVVQTSTPGKCRVKVFSFLMVGMRPVSLPPEQAGSTRITMMPYHSDMAHDSTLMDWLHIPALRLLVALSEAQSLSAAGRLIDMAQPNASRTIALMERRIGVRIIERSQRGSTLTQDGRLMASWAQEALDSLERFTLASQALVGSGDAMVSVGASQTVAEYLAPLWISRLRSTHPRITVVLHMHNSEQVVHGVTNGTFDIGFIESPNIPRHLNLANILEDQLKVVVSPEHD